MTMNPEPTPEHRWLDRLVGEWQATITGSMGPDQPDFTAEATETVRSLGGLWAIAEGTGAMPDGSPTRSLLTIGFDPVKGRFIGTFVASMMTHLWRYDGALDAAGTVLTLDTEGPDFGSGGSTASYQDILAFESEERRSMTSRMRRPDGTWVQVMRAEYQRRG